MFACDYKDTMNMTTTADMIRCKLAAEKTTFYRSMVSSNLQLVKMIEHRSDIKSQLENVNVNKVRLLSQLAIYLKCLITIHKPRALLYNTNIPLILIFGVYLELLFFKK